MKIIKLTNLVCLLMFLFMNCQSASYHSKQVSSNEDKLTVGKVQKEIRVGMSGEQVVSILGSPNIVTTDEKRREVWVYDKISTTNVYSSNAGGFNILVLGLVGESGASSTSQKTLTVIIKFDEDKNVRDFSYHASSF